MSLEAGTRFGTYEVAERIGAGGMGEVYRAHDGRLDRDVALKVLPAPRRLDPDAKRRFEQEARLLASLNHPNIATLHGIESGGDAQALVMELVEGETLDARVARHPQGLPVAEALEIARQLAAALDAAHERGIVHRDLKPANIKIRPDGTVKVLDFGIAKVLAANVDQGAVATVTLAPGAIAGTPSYMSPEQAGGGTIDRRTDIWAFGCVLYEMLSGQRAFDGDTNSRIVARVIERDPEWTNLPLSVPPRIRALLRQCLEKDPRRRRRDARDLSLELEPPGAADDVDGDAGRDVAERTGLWLAGATALTALAIAVGLYAFLDADEPPTRHFEISLPASRRQQHFAVSPDGRMFVFVASAAATGTVQQLYLRDFERPDPLPIPGTEGAKYPFWSPDSRAIGYFDSENLYALDLNGGEPRLLAPAQNGLGGAWGADGTIVFAPNSVAPLYRVSGSGRDYAQVTQLDLTQAKNHRFPAFLPDGRRFLLYVDGTPEVAGIHLGSLDGGPTRRLVAARSAAVFMAPYWVVFAQNDVLVAWRLDLDRGELIGEPLTIAAPMRALSSGYLAFSASTTGLLAYSDASETLNTTWFTAAGDAIAKDEWLNGPTISADGRYLAYDGGGAGRDVYIRDVERGDAQRLTTGATVEGYPVLSPYSDEVVFEKQRAVDQIFELWRAPTKRTDQEQLLYGTLDNLIPLDWSTDGYVLFRRSDKNFLSSDVLALPLLADELVPIVVADSAFEERMGAFSPDGRWVTYDTARSGRWEIVAQAFPDRGEVFRVSTNGGIAPLWSGNGTEIYFIALDGSMMVARIRIDGSELEAVPERLFPTEIVDQPYNQQYAVTSDRRFVVNQIAVEAHPSPIQVILDWRP